METTTSNSPRDELLKKIQLLRVNGLEEEAKRLEKTHVKVLAPDIPYGAQAELRKFITLDESTIRLKHKIGLLAPVHDTVLLHGPTGVGKELLARALHGDRDPARFISVNCAGLPDGLVESELFGHVKGAFTGAGGDKLGLFAQAENGTLFLDEVGELPLNIQAKLLRVIQERSIRRVGGNTYEPINVRIVSATHCDLEKMVEERKFREDLFWRLNTFHMRIPGLIERYKDILPITHAVCDAYESRVEKKFPRDYVIPASELGGNVRSIQRIVRRYHVFGELVGT